MKLKDRNDVLQLIVEDSLSELSTIFTTQHQKDLGTHKAFFSFWTNTNFLDADKNQCVRGVVDFGVINEQGKVVSFKKLIDRALVLRQNVGTLEVPRYGKQLGYEELRRKILSEVIGKGIASLALNLVEQTAEQVAEFNLQVPENKEE